MGVGGQALAQKEGHRRDSAVALLDDAAAALQGLRGSVLGQAAKFDFDEASEFAGKVEDLSRTVEYLQLVAAQAVERSRQEAHHTRRPQESSGAGAAWRTGWTDNADPHPTSDTKAGLVPPVLDDGFRNAAEFLRVRLRITIREARRRLALAGSVLPGSAISGQQVPPRHEELAVAVADALVSACSATLISAALGHAKSLADGDTIAAMERSLTAAAVESDPDFVARAARRWTDLIDQDGPEPTEEVLRQIQVRVPRNYLTDL